jgi:hypothetical protein
MSHCRPTPAAMRRPGSLVASALAMPVFIGLGWMIPIPPPGATYVYGRERLGRFWGYLAGWVRRRQDRQSSKWWVMSQMVSVSYGPIPYPIVPLSRDSAHMTYRPAICCTTQRCRRSVEVGVVLWTWIRATPPGRARSSPHKAPTPRDCDPDRAVTRDWTASVTTPATTRPVRFTPSCRAAPPTSDHSP